MESVQSLVNLATDIKSWGAALGFQQIAITDIDLTSYEPKLKAWIENRFHGEMEYMERNHDKRSHPDQLVPGTIRVICARMDYAQESSNSFAPINRAGKAYIARYARDFIPKFT